jgi:predicted transcriptional regulator
LLDEKPMRITDIAKEQDLHHPEIRRHIARLQSIGLVKRDLEGYYHLTPYGEISLLFFKDFEVISENSEYFEDHSLEGIQSEFVRLIGKLEECYYLENAIDFFHSIENLFKEANEYVWLLVDQFPINSLATIVETINRGVKFRIIETKDRVINPDIDALTSEETNALTRTRVTPLVDQRMLSEVTILIFLSENSCIFALPDLNNQFDFKGFSSPHKSSRNWCEKVFNHHWEKAEHRTLIPSTGITFEPVERNLETQDSITVFGQDKIGVDAQAVQDAVDNYKEVILEGTFNFGASMVQITRSVVIRGEGTEDGIPKTIIYKKGWNFPFADFDSVFKINGENADVLIENIYFTDFNHLCIWGAKAKSLELKNNRISLMTGYGRGMSYGAFGDVVIGIWIRGSEPSIFNGKVTIVDNFIDFARGGAFGGFLSRDGLEDNPEYRPDLFNHEYYMGFGIAVHQASNEVMIEDNEIRNINARGIAVTDCLKTAKIEIKNNHINSDIYGSYPFSSHESGSGILAQSAWGFPSKGFKLLIENNSIKFDKQNYSGIKILGPVIKNGEKLKAGIITKNRIELIKGYEGIHIRKCDEFEVTANTISGETYYGIRISGHENSDMKAINNIIKNNDMGSLKIREPDEYTQNHTDEKMFTCKEPKTSHFWLDDYTKNNEVHKLDDEFLIDEGTNNKIIINK